MHKVAFVYPMMQRQGFRGAEIAVENNLDQILRHKKGNQFLLDCITVSGISARQMCLWNWVADLRRSSYY
jgi:hypothetical protein